MARSLMVACAALILCVPNSGAQSAGCDPGQCAIWDESGFQSCLWCQDTSCACDEGYSPVYAVNCMHEPDIFCVNPPTGGAIVKIALVCSQRKECYSRDAGPCIPYVNPCITTGEWADYGTYNALWVVGPCNH